MSDIKEKIEMELKPLEPICDKAFDNLKFALECPEYKSAEEIMYLAKAHGAIVDSKKDIVEMCYKKQILEAMEDSEYGEDYDEEGVLRKGYRGQPRRANGQYMSRRYTMTPEMYHSNSPEYYRDMDRKNHNIMYYTGTSNAPEALKDGSNMGSESTRMYDEGYSKGYSDGRSTSSMDGGRVERTRRSYTDTKSMSMETPEDKQKSAKKLDEALKAITEEVTQMLAPNGKQPSNEEKTVWKKYLANWQGLIPN